MPAVSDRAPGSGSVGRTGRPGLVRRSRYDNAPGLTGAGEHIGVVLEVRSHCRVDCRMGSLSNSARPAAGTLSILPLRRSIMTAATRPCAAVMVQTPYRAVSNVTGLSPAAPDQAKTTINRHVPDLALASLVRQAVQEADMQSFWIERLVAHLATPYGAAPATPRPLRGGIPSARLRPVLQRIQDALGSKLHVATLATEARMSTYHFTRAFQQTMGLPPHRYIVHRRVERAIQLLNQSSAPVAEIARATGFAHASHFARAMRDLIGLTPREVRKRVLSESAGRVRRETSLPAERGCRADPRRDR